MSADDAWIADLWREVRPRAEAKVATIVRAAAAAHVGQLDAAGREAAWQEAHRLSGSLGSYGLDEAAHAAAAIEIVLKGSGPIDSESLAALVRRLVTAVAEGGGDR